MGLEKNVKNKNLEQSASALKMNIFACLTLISFVSLGQALKEGDCEVCISVMKRFQDVLPKEDASDPKKIETAFKSFCKDLKLKKKDKQICELRYEKQIDLASVDLKKLKVRDLKKILNDWDEGCDGCLEN